MISLNHMSVKKTRCVGRSIRLPFDLDTQIVEHCDKIKEDSYTRAMIHLIKMGLTIFKLQEEIKKNPTKAEEVDERFKKHVKMLTDEKTMNEGFADLTDKQLVGLRKLVEIEEESRQDTAAKAKEAQRLKKCEENMRLMKDGHW